MKRIIYWQSESLHAISRPHLLCLEKAKKKNTNLNKLHGEERYDSK